MRISDWSSDVCSSDLAQMRATSPDLSAFVFLFPPGTTRPLKECHSGIARGLSFSSILIFPFAFLSCIFSPSDFSERHMFSGGVRKSVVSGQIVSVSVGLGGRRTIKKKKIKNTQL